MKANHLIGTLEDETTDNKELPVLYSRGDYSAEVISAQRLWFCTDDTYGRFRKCFVDDCKADRFEGILIL